MPRTALPIGLDRGSSRVDSRERVCPSGRVQWRRPPDEREWTLRTCALWNPAWSGLLAQSHGYSGIHMNFTSPKHYRVYTPSSYRPLSRRERTGMPGLQKKRDSRFTMLLASIPSSKRRAAWWTYRSQVPPMLTLWSSVVVLTNGTPSSDCIYPELVQYLEGAMAEQTSTRVPPSPPEHCTSLDASLTRPRRRWRRLVFGHAHSQ